MDFLIAGTRDEALDLLAELGEDGRLIAGGTDVMVQLQRNEIGAGSLIDISRLGELTGTSHDGTTRMGALLTHADAGRDGEFRRRLPALVEACRTVGGWQTQEAGTIAGNVCNASPAADTIPPLLVAAAVVHLASRGGERTVPLDAFVLGRRRVDRRPDELVVAIEAEPVGGRAGEAYLKVGPRRGMEVALVGLAVRLRLDEDGETITDARVAVCSVAERPFLASAAEAALKGARPGSRAVTEAGERLREAASPIDDARASGAYRRRVLAPLLERAVQIAAERAKGA